MLSAESFIMSIDVEALSMDETEFQKNMEYAQTLLSGLSGCSDILQSQIDQNAGPVPRSEPVDAKRALNPNKHDVPKVLPQFSVESSQIKSRNQESNKKDQLPEILSISDLENKGPSMLLKEDKMEQVFLDFPYLYSQAGGLKVADVDDLLKNYKQLVFKYVCLSKGLGLVTSSPNLSILQCQTHYQSQKTERPEDGGEVKSSDEMHKGLSSTADDSTDNLLEVENSDLRLSADELVSTRTEEADER